MTQVGWDQVATALLVLVNALAAYIAWRTHQNGGPKAG